MGVELMHREQSSATIERSIKIRALDALARFLLPPSLPTLALRVSERERLLRTIPVMLQMRGV